MAFVVTVQHPNSNQIDLHHEEGRVEVWNTLDEALEYAAAVEAQLAPKIAVKALADVPIELGPKPRLVS